MKSTHSIRKIEKGVVELDNGTKWKPDPFGSSKVVFWSAPFDKIELDDAGAFSKMTNLSRRDTIGVSKCSLERRVRERITKLKQAIEQTEHCRAEHVESRVILHGFVEAPIWEGAVETFQLHDHPKAKRAYAWLRGLAHSPLEKPEQEYTIILGIPPVISPETAVRSAIMAEVRK